MKSNKTFLGLFILTLAAMLSITSCEKLKKWADPDVDPYSSTKDELYSLIGVKWEGVTYTQTMWRSSFTPVSLVEWGIVDIENKKHILIKSYLEGGGSYLESDHAIIYQIWMIIPFQNVEIGKTYSAKEYPSIVFLRAGKKIFKVDGEGSKGYHVPITITATFSKIGSKSIQGTFTADDGVVDMADGTQQNVVLKDGAFSLSYTSGHDIRDDALEYWLQSIDYSKSILQNYNQRD